MTHDASLCPATREPEIWGRATLAIEVSSTSINVATVTVMAIAQGLCLGFQRSGMTLLSFWGRIGRATGAYALRSSSYAYRQAQLMRSGERARVPIEASG